MREHIIKMEKVFIFSWHCNVVSHFLSDNNPIGISLVVDASTTKGLLSPKFVPIEICIDIKNTNLIFHYVSVVSFLKSKHSETGHLLSLRILDCMEMFSNAYLEYYVGDHGSTEALCVKILKTKTEKLKFAPFITYITDLAHNCNTIYQYMVKFSMGYVSYKLGKSFLRSLYVMYLFKFLKKTLENNSEILNFMLRFYGCSEYINIPVNCVTRFNAITKCIESLMFKRKPPNNEEKKTRSAVKPISKTFVREPRHIIKKEISKNLVIDTSKLGVIYSAIVMSKDVQLLRHFQCEPICTLLFLYPVCKYALEPIFNFCELHYNRSI